MRASKGSVIPCLKRFYNITFCLAEPSDEMKLKYPVRLNLQLLRGLGVGREETGGKEIWKREF